MTWSDPRGANPEACPHGWLGPSQCVAGTCDSCPSGHQTVEGYPKPGGPFHMEQVVGASLSEMIRGTKTCDKGAHCYAPQPITADLIGRGGGLCGTHLKQTNTGDPDQEDAWWIFEQISGPGMDEQQAIVSVLLNSQHRALMTSADLGQQVSGRPVSDHIDESLFCAPGLVSLSCDLLLHNTPTVVTEFATRLCSVDPFWRSFFVVRCRDTLQ